MNKFQKYGVPILIILVAIGMMKAMIKRKVEPEKVKIEKIVPTVSVQTLEQSKESITVVGNALVEPFEKVSIIPEVKGKATYVSEKLTSGDQIKKGELLIKINDSDYRLNLQSVKTNFENAKLGLQMEQEESRIAKEQWSEYQGRNPKAQASLFTLREPQLKKAEVTMKSAEAQVGLARLNLARTKIKAPFNAVAVSKSVDRGQVVGGGSVAVLYGTDRAKLVVALSKESVDLLGDIKGTAVSIITTINKKEYRWSGTVLGVSPELNRQSRMVNIIVTVDKPLTQNEAKELSYGLYVDVVFNAVGERVFYTIPRKALINGDTVRLLKGGKLHLQKVTLIKWSGDYAQIEGSIAEGDSLIVSSLDLTVDGMEVKVAQ